jgi:hypothetical protein
MLYQGMINSSENLVELICLYFNIIKMIKNLKYIYNAAQRMAMVYCNASIAVHF